MLNNNIQFKKKKNVMKITVGTVVIFFCLACLGNGIATSFGTMDEDMSKLFYKTMDTPFLRGFTAFTVFDGYIGIFTFAIPCGIVIAESIGKGCKKHNPQGGFATHQFVLTYLLYLVGIIYTVLIIVFLGVNMGVDNGMDGVNDEFIIGNDYMIPIFIVDILINFSIYVFLNIYIHKHVATQPDFLESKPGRKAGVNLFFIAVMYLVVFITLKQIMGRPYGFNIHGNDPNGPMAKFKKEYPKQYQHYLEQTKYNGGGTNNEYVNNIEARKNSNGNGLLGSGQGTENGKGYMIGKGGVSEPYSNNLPTKQAFPSGHMVAVSEICLCAVFFIDLAPIKNKKTKQSGKGFILVICALYNLDMIFSLQMSQTHGGSDTMFSSGGALVGYIISYGVINPIISGINNSGQKNHPDKFQKIYVKNH